ncbi:hypothetical protein AJ80_06344 [Polytolypa hystricis UAMH7299]|uniref:C2H2-type domain-containing protein n=1 Tax=Polytolypa hystricis (strain UAMH7299) TaxID=1447883 RepID=A0A2B7XWH0_POLH7|nr:hypothetical protein AJ80_06344 [Polytolypa hystricis UAMH7299]
MKQVVPKNTSLSQKQSAEKQFKCTTCDRNFTRIDHLKRHQLRHTGVRPYSCIFCKASFARCDNLRDHYADCSQRGDQLVPETSQRGRRRHALTAQQCTTMKLRCDGNAPCSSCQRRKMQCIRISSKSADDKDSNSAQLDKSEDYDQSFERGSVKFLLNAGTDSFTEGFHLPTRDDPASGLGWISSFDGLDASMGIAANKRADSVAAIESQPVNAALYNDVFLQFFNSPFANGPKDLDFPGTAAPGFGHHTQVAAVEELSLPISSEPFFEEEAPWSTTLIQEMLAKAWTLGMDEIAALEVSQRVRALLTTARIRKFIALYFRYWHVNCPIIHPTTFMPELMHPSIVASVVFMGAMYSDNPTEVYVAKRLLDLAELYIFSMPPFSTDLEIGRSFNVEPSGDEGKAKLEYFQHVRAGCIILIVQYWGGNKQARDRMVETRLGELIKVLRNSGATKLRHGVEDKTNECMWLLTECKLRTVCVITLLDAAFAFYQNFPPRLNPVELQCELPCHESLFSVRHPFVEKNFRFSREMTVYQAFKTLFYEKGPVHPLFTYPDDNTLHVGIFEMFLLMHILYSYLHNHLDQLIPVSESNSFGPVDSPVASRIKLALENWRSLWMSLRVEIPAEDWALMGFFKNAYSYWLVSQLLLSNKASVELIKNMDIKCDDKLQQLKVLLPPDESE